LIIVYAGRRAGDDFPDENSEAVSLLLSRFFSGLQPRLVIGAAAAGADQLILSSALKAGAKSRLVLAGGRDSFREGSVVDCGEQWGTTYDQLLSHERVSVTELPSAETDEATYRAATDRIWELAHGQKKNGEEIITLLVSRRRQGDDVDHTEELATHLSRGEAPVLRIDPLDSDEERPRAFVAMPFGIRFWRERRWKNYDADLTYYRILMPALIGAGYHPLRADTEALLEIIDARMLRAINRSPLLVADLATQNPNVMWELGIRHAWRRSGTILVAPDKTPVPFDVGRVTVSHYQRSEKSITDAECVHGLRLMEALLSDVDAEAIDSPVFENLDGLEVMELPEAGPEAESPAGELLEAITLAADLGQDEKLTSLRDEVASTDGLRDGERAVLEEQIGISLIGLGHHPRAAEILRPLVEADTDLSRVLLQEQFAHALIRDGDVEGREERLAEAEKRLEALIERNPERGETYGLLASASKARVELEAEGGEVSPVVLTRAFHAYMEGMRADPGDYYPGINAVALLRLRGQRLQSNDDDTKEAAELLPVVRFAVTREQDGEDPWAALTMAECDLHEAFLMGGGDLAKARQSYTVAAAISGSYERASAARQLVFFRNAGDPGELIDPLLELLS
jgi:tetratricopeptide (TPR) repeat protein